MRFGCECKPGCLLVVAPWLKLSVVPQAIRCCSGYPQGNLGIHSWRLLLIRTPPPIPGLSPNGSSYLQLEFRGRVARPSNVQPSNPPPGALQLSWLQGCNSLKIHAPHSFSEALTNQKTISRGDHWRGNRESLTASASCLPKGSLTADTSCHTKIFLASASQSVRMV